MANAENIGKDIAVRTEPEGTNYEAAYERHLVTAQRAKAEYERHFSEMVENLSTVHLEPLSAVLLEREKVALVGQDKIIGVMKDKLRKKLLEDHEMSWQSCNITNSLVSKEMLKERFKNFEGEDWQVQDMPPKLRLLPLRMYFKESSKRYLQKQIAAQNSKLEELIKTNSIQRTRVQDIADRRIYLMEAMEREAKQHTDRKQRLQELFAEALEQPESK